MFLSAAVAGALSAGTVYAQEWHRPGVATALSLSPVPDNGRTELEGGLESGAAHRAQEPGSIRTVGFMSQGYRTLREMGLYGRFRYRQQSLDNILLCDNWNPYDGNPYKVGSAIPGNYKRQVFDFALKASKPVFNDKLVGGVGLDYMVGDHSRTNDPRSRAQIMSIDLRPALTYKVSGVVAIGANLQVGYEKEKMNSLSAKAENLDRYKYYDLRGLSEFREAGIIGFIRRTPMHQFGGGMQLAMHLPGTDAILWWNISNKKYEVIGVSREAPGEYSSMNIDGGLTVTHGRHRFDVQAAGFYGNATEFMQEQRTTINDQGRVDIWWETLLEVVRYKNKEISASAKWTFSCASCDAGLGVDAVRTESKYILPYSCVGTGRVIPAAFWRKQLNLGRFNLAIDLLGGYAFAVDCFFDRNAAIEDATVQNLVSIPDFNLMSKNSFRLSGEAELSWPLHGRTSRIGLRAKCRQENFTGHAGSRSEATAGIILYH